MALKSLPDNLVSSMNGFLTHSTIHTEALHTKSTVQLEAISDRLGYLEDLIKMLLGAKKSARYKVLPPPPSLPPAVAIPSSHPQSVCQVPSSLAQNISPAITININGTDAAASEALSSTLAAVSHATLSSISTSHPMSLTGSPQPLSVAALPPTSAGETGDDVKARVWRELTIKFSELCLWKHAWKWREHDHQYVPFYTPQKVTTIREVWEEHASGLNGFLAERDLTEMWGAKWKCDIGKIKTEWGCRQRIIRLVNRLCEKP
ncbi:hypothetical protein PAXINDRAFT_17452 [Paxillus involutus ATCC 200175]|uniref:Transcription activator GCR1-like domain-containing protein n=1 Tax=Paxillus involutus ATCC 200175 TaxID=664439 RepID=A0A0C9TQL1_PAXIN|nr:hypothetical protein PAXINDRAFT_17452 [Paxillus involutus ATCC 200175]